MPLISGLPSGVSPKKEPPSIVEVSVLPNNWSGDEPPYTAGVNVSGVLPNNYVTITVPEGTTKEQYDTISNARIIGVNQGTNSLMLKAFGDLPQISIPLRFIISDDPENIM